jgi:hypothetical protein
VHQLLFLPLLRQQHISKGGCLAVLQAEQAQRSLKTAEHNRS